MAVTTLWFILFYRKLCSNHQHYCVINIITSSQETDTEGTVLIPSKKSRGRTVEYISKEQISRVRIAADTFKEEKESEELPSTSSYNPQKIKKEISKVEGNKKNCLTIKHNCK